MAITDRKAKNQHYVPKLLLRNFAFSNKGDKIYVFDKKTLTYFKTNIKNVAVEKNFYDIAFEGRKASLESALSNLEGATSSAFLKIIKNRSLSELSEEDKELIGLFIAAQHLRVKNFREVIKAMEEHISDKIIRMGGNPDKTEGWRPMKSETEIQNFSVSFLAKSIPEFSRLMHFKRWLLFETSKSNPFWIGDNPMAMHNDEDFGVYGNIGLACTGIQIHLPLSPTLLLVLWCPTIFDKIAKEIATAKENQQCLRLQRMFGLQRQMPEHNAQLAQYDQLLERNERMMARIAAGLPLACSPENVEFYNSLQVMWAERYLMSWKPKFSLAERMISDNKRFQRGMRMTIN